MMYLNARKEIALKSELDPSLVAEATDPSQNSYGVSKAKEGVSFGIRT